MKITNQAIAYLKGSPQEKTNRLSSKLSLENEPVVQKFLTGLHICYLVDKNGSYEYIQNQHLTEDGIGIDELHQIGLRNLKFLISQRDSKVQPHGNVFAFLMNGDFEASAILLDEFWNGEFRKFVKGKFAAAIPARDVLAFCDSDSAAGIAELHEVISRVWPANEHLVSDRILIRQPSGWEFFVNHDSET
jgi:uncharacterized protein YtpQ (UPF0354 family)